MPHEIAAYQSPYIPPPGASPSAEPFGSPDASQEQLDELEKDDDEDSELKEQDEPTSTAESRLEGQDASQHAVLTGSQNASASFTEVPSSQPPPSSQESASGRMGYLANRRNGGSFRASQEDSANIVEPNSQPESQENIRKGLKRSSSLRMTWKMDGSAYLATDSTSPSPPQKLAAPPTEAPESVPFSLQRSQSNVSLQDTSEIGPESFSLSQGSTSSLRRKPSGRSRDSRAWAFFADKEARSELEERAEQEQTGSAADAIKHLRRSTSNRSLARSASERNLLQPVSTNKRPNPTPPSFDSSQPQPASAKRIKTSNNDEGIFRQPLLPRSASGTNLQRPRHQTSNSLSKLSKTKTPKLKQTAVFEMPSATDSDKENWSPERAFAFEQSMQTSPAVPGTVSASARRKVAMAQQTPRQRGAAFKTPSRVRSLARDEDEEDDDDDEDEDVVAFMGMGTSGLVRRREEERVEDIERKSDSVSEPEDLDCVQGLLSLSQGAWR